MKTIIEMAREAGLHRNQHNLMSNPVKHRYSYDGYEENLEAFATLVRADEREWMLGYLQEHQPSMEQIAKAIQARVNSPIRKP